jgi:hypothetical protein
MKASSGTVAGLSARRHGILQMISLPRPFNAALVGIQIAPRDLDGPDLKSERVDQDGRDGFHV